MDMNDFIRRLLIIKKTRPFVPLSPIYIHLYEDEGSTLVPGINVLNISVRGDIEDIRVEAFVYERRYYQRDGEAIFVIWMGTETGSYPCSHEVRDFVRAWEQAALDLVLAHSMP